MPSIVAPGTPFPHKIIAIAGIALLLLALAGVLVAPTIPSTPSGL